MNIHYNSNIFIDILDKMMGKREPSILEESERYPGGGRVLRENVHTLYQKQHL